jgi:hypothetical protein
MTIIEVLYSCLIVAAVEIDLIKIVAVVVVVDSIVAVVIGVDNGFDLSTVIATIPLEWRLC